MELRALEQFAEGNRIEMPGIWEVHERLKEGRTEKRRKADAIAMLSQWDGFDLAETPLKVSLNSSDGVLSQQNKPLPSLHKNPGPLA